MENKLIKTKEELIRDWRQCFIVGTKVKTLKDFLEGFELGIKIYKKDGK